MKNTAAAFLLILLGTAVAQAQDACPALPPPTDVTSAVDSDGLDKALLTPGQAALVALHPTKAVAYSGQPEKPGGSMAQGGLVAVTIPQAGTWQVSLSSGAWIDVLQNGVAAVSTAHGPASVCSGLRKMVDFPLMPGRVTLQISASIAPSLTVLVSRKP